MRIIILNILILVIVGITVGQTVNEKQYPYLKPKPEISQSLFNIGLFEKDSFLLTNICLLPKIDIYNLSLHKSRNGDIETLRLVSFQQISNDFSTYIVFDDYCGEAGCYMLYTVDTSGYLINSIEFNGGEGYEFGGYITSSKFLNDTLILNSYSNYKREKDASGKFLKTWEIETIETKYSIAKDGEIFINSKKKSLLKKQDKWY